MPSSPRKRDVWLVDDSPTDLERARRVLSQWYAVRAFADASTMLEELTAGPLPDVLVVDWVMSGTSGLDVCSYIHSAPPPVSWIPVLLLTSHDDEAHVVEGFKAGASDYVAKPYADEVLRVRVQALVRQRVLIERAASAEADVRRLLSTAPDALFVVDAQGTVQFANDETIRVSGRSAGELVGQPASTVFPGLSLHHISVGPGESLLPVPDVRIGDRLYSPSIRILESDNAAVTTVALRDVTSQRKAEERRLDFYSMIAHDLRSPLAAMLMRTDLILRGKHGVLRPELAADLRKISSNARSLVSMINDFLDLARLEGTGRKIERAPVAIARVVTDVCDDYVPLFESGELSWSIENGDSPVEVLGDRLRLMQVFGNLMGNAVKFTPRGGKVTARVVDLGPVVEVQVQDTGPGIAPEDIERVFDRYERGADGEEPSISRYGGSGLGLMIVREVIQAHGGQVGVTSEIGRGSTFWFRLAKAPPRQQVAPEGRGDTPQVS